MSSIDNPRFLYADALRQSAFRRFIGAPGGGSASHPVMAAARPAAAQASGDQAQFVSWLEAQSARFRGKSAPE
jgi:hypothetical protein